MTNDQPERHRHWTLVIGYLLVVGIWSLGFFSSGCDNRTEVVLYTSVDEPVARPIVNEFETQTGIHVRLVTDTEASKSVGLAERLRAEKSNPQADVWWGNEPFHTILLADEGLLQQYDSPSAHDVNAMYRDPQHHWAGNGLRARVIAMYLDDREMRSALGKLLPDADQQSLGFSYGFKAQLQDLVGPKLHGKIAMARPTAGTTGGHVASLYVLWGQEKADHFFKQLYDNDIKLLGGNGPVADAIGQGQITLGLTDNDDADSAKREGGKLTAILPDQDGQGTLMLPTTVGLVTGTKQAEASKKLIDYLLSPQVEQKLLDAKFAGWSVRKSNDVKAMQLDYNQVARAMPPAVRRATAILEGREIPPSPSGRGPG